MNKKVDKFKFVTNEETLIEDNNIDNIDIIDTPTKVNVEVDDTFEEKPSYSSDNKQYNEDIKGRFHISFELRVVIMIFIILLLFGGACLLILESLNYSKGDTVKYDETSKTSYQVCLKDEDSNCLGEGSKYSLKNTKSINITFDYNVTYDKNTQINTAYYVTSYLKIYDNEKVLHTDEKTIIDRSEIIDNNSSFSVYKDITYDYLKDLEYVINYKDIHNGEYKALVEVALYVEEDNNNRKVSSITLPLNEDNYEIKKFNISNSNKIKKVDNSGWNNYSTICASIASLLILISLVLIYKTTRLVLKVTSNRSNYQQKLLNILREYDSIIVIARDGYETDKNRKVVKVDSFDSLLDIKDNINKPIIFSKVNDIKCEFIIEDEDELYKYVLKDEDK